MNWDDIFGAVAGLAGIGLVGYAAYKITENMDNWIDELIQVAQDDERWEEPLFALANMIPQMDEETWALFAERLTAKAEHNEDAAGLLGFSACVVNSIQEIHQVLAYSIQDAAEIILSVLPQKEEIEQLAFIGTLCTYSEQNMKAKAIWGRVMPALEG